MDNPWANGRKGIDILADILRFTDVSTTRNLLKNLQAVEPRIAAELRRRIMTFEDLASSDRRGLQQLLKTVKMRDLALALKGAPEQVLQHIALQMSPRAIEDLRDEIALIGPSPVSEINAARDRIMGVARRLVEAKQMYFERSDERMVT